MWDAGRQTMSPAGVPNATETNISDASDASSPSHIESQSQEFQEGDQSNSL